MSRTPLEQLDALRSSQENRQRKATADVVVSADDAVEVAHSDVAYQRVLSALEPMATIDLPIHKDGAISTAIFEKFWHWAQRDLDQIEITDVNTKIGSGPELSDRDIEVQLARIVKIAEPILTEAEADSEFKRRISIQMGGPEVFDALPLILMAFKFLSFIRSGFQLGRELNSTIDAEAFSYALEHARFPSVQTKKLWCLAFVEGTTKVELLANTIAEVAYESSETAIRKTGLSEYVDAFAIHAQKQIEIIERQ